MTDMLEIILMDGQVEIERNSSIDYAAKVCRIDKDWPRVSAKW